MGINSQDSLPCALYSLLYQRLYPFLKHAWISYCTTTKPCGKLNIHVSFVEFINLVVPMTTKTRLDTHFMVNCVEGLAYNFYMLFITPENYN